MIRTPEIMKLHGWVENSNYMAFGDVTHSLLLDYDTNLGAEIFLTRIGLPNGYRFGYRIRAIGWVCAGVATRGYEFSENPDPEEIIAAAKQRASDALEEKRSTIAQRFAEILSHVSGGAA